MKEKILRKIKSIMIFVLGILVSGVSVYKAAGKLYASSIDVDTSKMSELGETSNVNLALNYLYGKAESISSTSGIKIYPTIQSDVSIVYFNPKDLKEVCTKKNSVSTPGTKEGCMKWYIYDETVDKYIAILDHDTSANVIYNSSGNGTTQDEIATALTTDTTGWDEELTVRLIKANEIAKVTGASKKISLDSSEGFYLDGASSSTDTTLLTQTKFSKGSSNYAWLFDYTSGCTSYGCNIAGGGTGYWTGTVRTGNSALVWYVDRCGGLFSMAPQNYHGLRPVIEIPKTYFE